MLITNVLVGRDSRLAASSLQAMIGLVVVVLLMAGIISIALVQTRSAYTASFGSILDAGDLRSPQHYPGILTWQHS